MKTLTNITNYEILARYNHNSINIKTIYWHTLIYQTENLLKFQAWMCSNNFGELKFWEKESQK